VTIRRLAFAVLSRLRHGRLELVEDGRRYAFGPADAGLSATVFVRDRRFWRALPRGSVGLAEAWMEGWWDCDDQVTLVRLFARELPALDRVRRLLVPLQRVARLVPQNTRAGARRHIAAHYDLGNDLFELFLDETMTYSCAVFDPPEATLREAQEEKLDRACRKLELRPDDHLVEIGAGWGSLAIHAAAHYGCRVTTTTISRRQKELAARRVAQAGVADRVTLLFQDYRDLPGTYDKLVSIEMIEAVGWQYFDLFFRRCSELLRPEGLMLLQAIVIDDRAYEAEKATKSFANTFIFPGGCLPSLEVIARCVAGSTDMRAVGLEDITEHYPETLRRWRERFFENEARLEALGYDARFRRLWEMYLTWSEGGFRERRLGDVQLVLAKPDYRESRLSMGLERVGAASA
jgi:cyclopropane-fatty-acyl-phospholipid synthase